MLIDVYAGSLGKAGIDPVTQQGLVRAVDTDPVYLETTWEVWVHLMVLYGWSEPQIDDARYWRDAEFVGGLAIP